MNPTRESHQRRAIEPDGTVHAARYTGDRQHVTTACAVYPAPRFERLEHEPTAAAVTCTGCLAALTLVITCRSCHTPGAEQYLEGSVPCARCTACGEAWMLDPDADPACTVCGGSGHTGRGSWCDPACSCHAELRRLAQHDRLPEITARLAQHDRVTHDDVLYLIHHLTQARRRLDEVRYLINDAGSMMTTAWVARAIGHIRISGHDPRTPATGR